MFILSLAAIQLSKHDELAAQVAEAVLQGRIQQLWRSLSLVHGCDVTEGTVGWHVACDRPMIHEKRRS